MKQVFKLRFPEYRLVHDRFIKSIAIEVCGHSTGVLKGRHGVLVLNFSRFAIHHKADGKIQFWKYTYSEIGKEVGYGVIVKKTNCWHGISFCVRKRNFP